MRRAQVLLDGIAYRKKMDTADLAEAVRMAQNAEGEDFKKYIENLTSDE